MSSLFYILFWILYIYIHIFLIWGGDSESTLFIDIASPIDSYATRKRNANLENVSLEVDLMSPDLDVLDSYKKVSQENNQY